MLFGALAPLIPGYADEFGLSKTGAGLLVASFGAGALLGGIPGGLAALRWGPQVGRRRRARPPRRIELCVRSRRGAPGRSPASSRAPRATTWAGALAWLTVATPRSAAAS